MKYLIAGLGNIGSEYTDTRHNIGFMTLDAWAQASGFVFTAGRYAHTATVRIRNRQTILIKPSTYMNLSGKAVRYWMEKENVPVENLLIILDDLALPPGTIRLKPDGSDGGHNGLKSINEVLGTSKYARLRMGIGAEFSRGRQSDYVLSSFSDEEKKVIVPAIEKSIDAVKSFVTEGIQTAMNKYNTRPDKKQNEQKNGTHQDKGKTM